MKIDYSPRQSGKTTRMIEQLRSSDGLMITFNHDEESRLRRLYADVSKKIFCVGCYKLNKMAGIKRKHLLVDNADLILMGLFSDPIAEASISND